MDYKKILIAKHNPKNLCFAKEGESLVPAGPRDKKQGRLPKDDHFFVGLETGLPSRYGWVKELDRPIAAEELARLKDGGQVSKETIQSCEILLRAVAEMPEDTPMACHYLEVKLPGERHRRLKVHKVIFYQA